MLSLDSYPDGEPQRLRLQGVGGWSKSPKGPFVRESGFDGPIYGPGTRTYTRLRSGDVWSIATLIVREHDIDVEVLGPLR